MIIIYNVEVVYRIPTALLNNEKLRNEQTMHQSFDVVPCVISDEHYNDWK